jgi:hypothetical protein
MIRRNSNAKRKSRTASARVRSEKEKSRTAPLETKGCGTQLQLPIKKVAKGAPPARRSNCW